MLRSLIEIKARDVPLRVAVRNAAAVVLPLAAGIAGGLIGGALLGGALAAPRYYGPGYYGYGPAYYGPGYGYYGGPAYVAAPDCYWQRQRFWDGYGWRIRHVRVCG